MYQKYLKTLLSLVKVQSDTRTSKENAAAKFIFNYFSKLPKFIENQNYGYHHIENDLYNRRLVWGFVEGEGDKTVVLLNHHDVVDAYDYGNLKPLAYSPQKLKVALKKMTHNKEVLADLNSENWLFGRGAADMKSGVIIHMAMIETLSRRNNFKGNVLFISVPDEESLSVGMRAGSIFLNDFRQKKGLDYVLLINSEPHTRENGCYKLYDGSVGKTMFNVYVRGVKSHIGNIFTGLNPLLILSEIIKLTEVNANFVDCAMGEYSPPPAWSYVKDFKEMYDASIPESAGGYMSILTLDSSAKTLIEKIDNICQSGMKNAFEHIKKQYKKIYPNCELPFEHQIHVKSYHKLYQDALLIDEVFTKKRMNEIRENIKIRLKSDEITMQEANFIIISELLNIIGYNKPTVIYCISPPYYPHISSHYTKKMSEKSDEIYRFLKNELSEIERQHYFMGISDLSYVGLQNADKIISYIEPNMPLWDESIYTVPFDSMKKLTMPSIILGPWGKDLHKFTERVYLPDVLEVTPKLTKSLILHVLDN